MKRKKRSRRSSRLSIRKKRLLVSRGKGRKRKLRKSIARPYRRKRLARWRGKRRKRKSRRRARLAPRFTAPVQEPLPDPVPEALPDPVPEAPVAQQPLPAWAGINLIGFIHAEFGIGESCRLAAKSLATTDIPFGIINLPLPVSHRMDDHTWDHKLGGDQYPINVFHINADFMAQARNYFGHGLFHQHYSIGYWHWEMPIFTDKGGFEHIHEIWTPTRFVQQNISKQSPVQVFRIPHGIELEVPAHMNRDTFCLPHDRFLFQTMYDVQSITQRKNPQAAIAAFKQAFAPNDPHVGLVLKINNLNSRPSDRELLGQLIQGYPNIYMIDQMLSRVEVNALLNNCDAYISLHRSEGFGLGLAEAMYLGKPAIGTNWSGNTDFMNVDNSCPIDYHLTPVGPEGGPYAGEGQYWAEPSIAHAASCMRELVTNTDWRNRIAKNGQQTIRTQFSPQAVGQMIRERLLQLQIG